MSHRRANWQAGAIWDFSDSEQVTDQRWDVGSDNLPVYSKVVTGTLGTGLDTTVAHGISNLETIVKIEGMITDSATGRQFMLPVASQTSTDNIRIHIDATNINLQYGGSGFDSDPFFVILYYTKSTD